MTSSTETSTWSRVQPDGEGPSARDKLASAVIGKDIYVFGGFGPQREDVLLEVCCSSIWVVLRKGGPKV